MGVEVDFLLDDEEEIVEDEEGFQVDDEVVQVDLLEDFRINLLILDEEDAEDFQVDEDDKVDKDIVEEDKNMRKQKEGKKSFFLFRFLKINSYTKRK